MAGFTGFCSLYQSAPIRKKSCKSCHPDNPVKKRRPAKHLNPIPDMKTAFYTLFLTGLLAACSSGKSAYMRGEYADAVEKASTRLNQKRGLGKRGHDLAGLVIQRAFVQGYAHHQAIVRQLSQGQEPFRWERVFAEYETLQKMTADARSALPNADWLGTYPADYAPRLAEARQLAADERMAVADAAFAFRTTNRMAARDAVAHYQKALAWVPTNPQAVQRSLEAQQYGTLRVLVEPMVLTPELDPTDTRELGNDVFTSLQTDQTPAPFVHLYNPDQVEVANGEFRLYDGFKIDETVQFAVSRYVPFDEHTVAVSTVVESDKLYKVGTKRINDSTVVDVMEKVKGTLTLHTHSVNSHLSVRSRAINTQTDRVIWTDEDHATTGWQEQWETFTGDERALNGHTLLTTTGAGICPTRWKFFSDLSSCMSSSLVGTLRRHYRKR